MNIEAWNIKEEENKKKKLSDKEKTFQQKNNLDFKKNREKSEKSEQTEKNLNNLKDLLDKWTLDSSTTKLIEDVTSSEEISQEQIQEIFIMIDEIENNEKIDKYLPEESRITKDEYKKALTDDVFRTKIITKLSTALTILAQHVNPSSWMWVNLFTWFLAVLDKNLIIIQENHVDIKNSLEEVENKRNPQLIELSFYNKIKIFIKELFN